MVPNHEHKNFDILGYLVSGELEHCDSLGNCVRATSGQIQHMWCGSSIWHSEANLGAEPARYLQIWITPDDQYCDTAPYYEIINKPIEFGPIIIDLKHNMQIHAGVLAGTHTIDIGDTSYLYVVSGVITGNDFELHSGDGAELDAALTAAFDAHVILFTVAKNI